MLADGRRYEGDTRSLEASTLPLALAGASSVGLAAAALRAIVIGTAIVIAGILFIMMTIDLVEQIVAWNKSRPASSHKEYFQAELKGGRLFLGKRLSWNQAVARGKSGKDVWSIGRVFARSVASGVKSGATPVGPEVHGKGYFFHYHRAGRSPSMHSFYGTAS